MPDGFPVQTSDEDYPVQKLVSWDLENARDLWAAYHARFPRGGSPGAFSFLARQQERPSVIDLYPELARANSRTWLAPILRRLRWQKEQGQAAREYRIDLAWMVNILLRDLRPRTEEQLIALADHADCFDMPPAFEYLDLMQLYVKAVEKSGPLRGAGADAVGKLLDWARHIHRTTSAWERFAWPFFRSTAMLAPGDPCWAAAVRRDLEDMEAGRRERWLEVFDGKYKELGKIRDLSAAGLATLKELGREPLETDLPRWIGMLKDGPEPRLSPVGTVIVRHILLLATRLGGKACDDLLYAVACAPWRRPEETGWLDTYLWILGRRSWDRAFPCLEALAMNPATATEDVKQEYDGALASFTAEARGTGIDGYRWDTDPALEKHQRRIEEMLQMCAVAVAKGPYVHPTIAAHVAAMKGIPESERTAAMKLFSAQLNARHPWYDAGPAVRESLDAIAHGILRDFPEDPASLHRAAANRWEWIRGRRNEYPRDLVMAWEQCFHGFACARGLLGNSLARVKTVQPDALVRIIQTSPGRWKVFELCQQHVAEHGWNAELAQAFREWISTLGTSQTDNEYRAKAEWFLWFEDILPLKLESCWGERVRRDLREMKAEERQAWRGLLGEGSFRVTDAPTKKWLQPAEKAFPTIGTAVFRRRFVLWFAAFGAGEALRLTVTGRNVLRLLMWSALIAKDPAVDQALAGFAKAQWKTKENERRASQAEMAFSYVLAERAPETALPILEEMVRSKRAYPGSASYKMYQALRARLK